VEIFEGIPILSILILLPILSSIFIFIFARSAAQARNISIAISGIVFFLTLLLLYDFKIALNEYQYVEGPKEWIKDFGISYHLGLDGLSFPLFLLTTLITPLAILFAWKKEERGAQFFGLILLLESAILGVFCALDFFLFFIFWEVVLIPMYFLIAIWGGPNKAYASIKFFIYTHVGSVIMLIAIFILCWEAKNIAGWDTISFNMIEVGAVAPGFTLGVQSGLFLAFLFGFGVKMPMVPFHTWLPDAHVEAPTSGSVLLAALLLKMGGYGLIRIGVAMLPKAVVELAWLLAILGTLSMVYGAYVCLAQTDLKKMIAYSSISHMGFVLLGIASLQTIGMTGAIFQMFNHGLITSVLFMMCGVYKHHAGTRMIPDLRGTASRVPLASFVLIVSFFASLGLPGLNGFVSEFFVFVGGYHQFGFWILIPMLTIIITAAYYLWTLHKILFGDFNTDLGRITDLEPHESFPLFILLGLIIFFGLAPMFMVDIIDTYSGSLIDILGPFIGGGG